MSHDAMALRAFRHLVTEALGLDCPSDKVGELQAALQATRQELGLPDLGTLFERLEMAPSMGELWRPLRERLTVGESYFFRDPGQLEVIRHQVLGAWASQSHGRRLRFWSAGCSTGEEAYTLAILAAEVLPAALGWQVEVLGTDLNEAALDRARAARYRAWSFRGVDASLQARWFTPSKDEWTVSPALRGMVKFKHHNLVQDSFTSLSGEGGFDLILCRNVFIYFPPSVCRTLARHFAEVLAPQGVLVLGHNELAGDPPPGFRVEHHAHSTLLRRDQAMPEPGPPRFVPAQAPKARPLPPAILPFVAHPPPQAPPAAPDLVQEARRALGAGNHVLALELARKVMALYPRDEGAARVAIQALANLGRGEEAVTLLEEALGHHPVSASLHYLKSLLASDQGRTSAVVAALDRVIYLAPDHVAALMDRARIHQDQGKVPEALKDLRRALEVASRLDEKAVVEGLEPFRGRDVHQRCADLLAHLEPQLERRSG